MSATTPRTLLLAESPFRDLLSRAILAEARQAVPHAPPMLVATRAERAPAGFESAPPGEVPAGVEQVLLAGVFLDRRKLEQALAIAAEAVARGARLVVHNFGVEGSAAQIEAPDGVAVLEQAGSLGLRDHRTANVLTLWRLGVALSIQAYPERDVEPDRVLASTLPEGPILGLSIRGGDEMRRSWLPRLPAIGRLLRRASGWPVLPLPTRVPGTDDDDIPATLEIAATVLPGSRILLPEIADPAGWRRQLTPARFKALVARCHLVLTNRDLVAAYAVAAGVPVLGLALGADRRIVSCLATLANDLPPGSSLVHAPPGEQVQGG